MALNSLKTIVTLFDKTVEQLDKTNTYARRVKVGGIEPNRMQNANNIFWRPIQQQRALQTGWNMTGNETDIIQQGVPLQLQDPVNDFVGLRVDDLRDMTFINDMAVASADQFNADQNKKIADLVADTGTLYYESAEEGFDFVAEADTIMTERQCYRGQGSSFFLTPRANQVMASDLASRSDLSGRPEDAYATAMIGKNVAGFDVFRAPTYGTQNAAVNATTTTVASDVTEVPSGSTGTTSPSNVDYRSGVINLTSAANFRVGDVITIAGVNALGLRDKTDTGELMTFKITEINTNAITVFPKPIAANQAGITTEQAAYANISTAIVSAMDVSKVNLVGGQCNSFWADDSIEIVNSEAPLELLNEFDGMKVVKETLDSGVTLFMAYDARLDSLQARVRLFTWYGLVNLDPTRNGNAIYTP